MSTGVFLLVALGGGIGAALRFVVDGFVMHRERSGFPWGTFLINTTGSFALGLLAGLAESSALSLEWLAVLGGGAMGGYTTFSTAVVDTVRMLHRRAYGRALWNGLGMIVVTVVVALAGLALGRGL